MKKLILLIITITILCASTALAQPVTATGYGTTASEAEQDAMRNAVEQITGTLVDSRTLTENYQIVEDNIYLTSRGFIQNYTVTDRRNAGGAWQVTIDADIDTDPNSALMTKLTRIGIIRHSLRDAKIGILIPQDNPARQVPDTAAETAVTQALLEAGFTSIIDISQTRYDHLILGSSLTIDKLRSIADSLRADILIVGEADSERGRNVPYMSEGIISCKATIEAKMYLARTGQIIAVSTAQSAAIDTAETTAAQKALTQAGTQIGQYMADRLLDRGSTNRQQVEMVVITNNINDVNRLKNELMQTAGVSDVKFSRWDAGRATLAVSYSGAPETLYSRLSAVSAFFIEAVEITYDTLTVRI